MPSDIQSTSMTRGLQNVLSFYDKKNDTTIHNFYSIFQNFLGGMSPEPV